MSNETRVRSRTTSNASRREFVVYENEQRFLPLGEFTSLMVPGLQRPRFSDEQGNKQKPQKISLEEGWKWEEPEWSPWIQPGFTDDAGWTYAPSFLFGSWSATPTAADFVRRRRLQRHATLGSVGGNVLSAPKSAPTITSKGSETSPLRSESSRNPNDGQAPLKPTGKDDGAPQIKATDIAILASASGDPIDASSPAGSNTPSGGRKGSVYSKARPLSIQRPPDIGQGLVNELVILFQSLPPIEDMCNRIGTEKDTTSLRRQIQSDLDDVKLMSKDFKEQLSIFESQNRTEKNQAVEVENRRKITKLKGDFEKFCIKYEQVCTKFQIAKQKAGQPVAANRPISLVASPSQGKMNEFNLNVLTSQPKSTASSSDRVEESTISNQQVQTHLMEMEEEIEANSRMIAEREVAIKQLEEAMMGVNELFKDLATLVETQGETLAIIDANISTALHYTDAAVFELKQANHYQKGLSLAPSSKVDAEEKERRALREKQLQEIEVAKKAKETLGDCEDVFFYPRHALPGFVLWSTLAENEMFIYQKYRAKLWPYKYRILMKDGYMLLGAHMDREKMDKAWAFLEQVNSEHKENKTAIATSQFLSTIKKLKSTK